MFKTYMRLLGFVSPISKYAVPYFFLRAAVRPVQHAHLRHDPPDHEHAVRRQELLRFPTRLRLSHARALVLGHRRLADVELRLYATVRDEFHDVENAPPARLRYDRNEPVEQFLPLHERLDGRKHACQVAATHAQRSVQQNHGDERRIFQRSAQGRSHVAHHTGRHGGPVLHHQYAASRLPRSAAYYRLRDLHAPRIVAVVPVRHPVPARSGAHHRTDRQKTAPPGPQRAGTHGRHGKRARRIAFGHQGHQKLQRHRLYPPQVLRVQRRIFAPDALDGPPPATQPRR